MEVGIGDCIPLTDSLILTHTIHQSISLVTDGVTYRFSPCRQQNEIKEESSSVVYCFEEMEK